MRTYFVPVNRAVNNNLSETFGKWAVITGATSLLGVAFANEFASHGMNVVLISRSYDNLLQVVSDIQSKHSVQAYGIHADFFLGQHVFTEIEEALLADKLDIGILVNTNPIHYDHPQYFSQVPVARLWQIVNVNIAATTMMIHVVLPRMLERGRGAVINVSSCLIETLPTPLASGDIAAMVYVDSLAQGLHEECKRKGLVIQTLNPWTISSNSIHSLLSPSPEVYVKHALNTLGISSRCCGYWPHAILASFYQLIPNILWVWLTGKRNRLKRQQCLVTALSRQDKQLFARKPRRISVPHSSRARSPTVPHRTTERQISPSPLTTHEHSPRSGSPVPYHTLSERGVSHPSYNRTTSYSRVMIVPSIIKDNK